MMTLTIDTEEVFSLLKRLITCACLSGVSNANYTSNPIVCDTLHCGVCEWMVEYIVT